VSATFKRRLANLETVLLPKDSPTKCWQIVVLNQDGTKRIMQTLCWSRTRGSWTEPAPDAVANKGRRGELVP
jgi:hypothetical protein